MKPLNIIIEKKKMKWVQVARTEKVAVYAQFLGDVKIAFEVFQIKTSNGYTFPNGLTVPPQEVFPSAEAFGKTAWSFPFITSEAVALNKAISKFESLNNLK